MNTKEIINRAEATDAARREQIAKQKAVIDDMSAYLEESGLTADFIAWRDKRRGREIGRISGDPL